MKLVQSFRAILTAAALGCAMTGLALAAESPACALLTQDEAILALRGAPEMKDGGPAKRGYSDCAWIRPGATLSLLYWSQERFPEGAPGAAEYYAGLAARSIQRRLPVSQIEGLGEQAMLIDESSGGLPASTILVLKSGQVVQLSQRGVSRADALGAARAVTGRLPRRVEIADAADTAASPGPVETPDKPPAADQPEMAELEPEASAPQPDPPAPAPRPAAGRTDTAACALLTVVRIEASLGASQVEMAGGGVEGPGDTTCAWRDAASRAYVAVNLVEGEAIAAVAADANAYFGQLDAPQPGNGIERLGGVGEAAYLAVIGEGEAASYSFSILSNGKVAFLDVAGANRAAALKLAQAVAGAM